MMYSVYCTVYRVPCTVYTVYSTQCPVHCTELLILWVCLKAKTGIELQVVCQNFKTSQGLAVTFIHFHSSECR